MEIGVLGGTGPAGQGIAARLAALGHQVVLGSRDRERAAGIVDQLQAKWGERVATLEPGVNADAAGAPVVVVATVWDAAVPTARDLAGALAGKVVIAMANGLEKQGRQFRAVMPAEGSIAEAIQAAAPGARVVAALQHVPAKALADLDTDLGADVLVAGDDDEARTLVLDLIDSIPGLRGLDAGSLENARGIEAVAAPLLTVNLRHRGEATLRLPGAGERRR
ncbi:MAG TPA: NADPH-dependent F420 reductase [Acidimicrobiia bacterium]